jgi:hypothetical protein
VSFGWASPARKILLNAGTSSWRQASMALELFETMFWILSRGQIDKLGHEGQELSIRPFSTFDRNIGHRKKTLYLIFPSDL